VAALALYLARGRVVAPLAVRWIEARAARAGYDLAVERVGGDWFDVIEIEGLRLAALDASGAMRELSIERATVELGLVARLRGESRWLERVDVRGARVVVDAARGPRPRPGGPRAPRLLPRWWPPTIASGIDVRVVLSGGRSISIEDAYAALAPSAERAALALDLPRARVELGERTLWLAAQGTGSLRESAFDLERIEISGDVEAAIERSTFALETGGGAAWELRARSLGGELASAGRSRRGAVDARFEIAALDLAALARAIEPCAPPAVEGELSAAGEVGGEWAALRLRASAAATGVRSERFDCASAAGEIAWSARTLAIERLDAGASYVALAVDGAEIALDADGWLERLRAVRGRVALEVGDLDQLRRAVARAARESREPAAAARGAIAATERAEIAGRFDATGFEIERAVVVTHGGSFAIERGRVEWSEARERTLLDSRVDADLAVEFADIARIGQLATAEPWRGELRGRAHLAGTLSEPRGALVLAGRGVAAGAIELGELAIRADVDPLRLHLRSLEAHGPLGHLELSAEVDLEARAFDSARLRASVGSLGAVAPGAFAAGAVDLTAVWSGALHAPEGTFELAVRDVALAGPRAPIVERAAVHGRFSERRVDLVDVEASTACSLVRASGSIGHAGRLLPLDLVVDRLAIERADLFLAAATPIVARVERAAGSVEGVDLRGTAGELLGDVRWSESEVLATLRSHDLDPMPLVAPLVPEGSYVSGVDADFRATLRGRELALAGGADVRTVRLRAGAPEFSLHALGALGSGRAWLDELALRWRNGGSIEGSGEFACDPLADEPFPDGELRASVHASLTELGDLPWRELGSPVRGSGSLALEVEVEGRPSAVRGTLEARGEALVLAAFDAAGAGSRPLGPASLALRASLGERLAIERCEIDAPGQVRASVAGAITAPRTLAGLADGATWRAAALDLRADVSAPDLGFVGAWAAGLRRVGGSARASVALGGTFGDVRVDGEAELADGELRFEGAQRGIDAIAGRVRFDSGRAEIEELRGEVGGGTIEARGAVDLTCAEPALDLAVTGKSLSIARTGALRLRADAELAARGPWSKLAIGGRFDLRDSRYQLSIEVLDLLEGRRARPRASRALFELFSFEAPPLATAELEIAIGAVEPFVIDTNRGDVEIRPASLYLRGTGHAPILVGAATCEPARIKLPASRLALDSGVVRWTESDPLVPHVDAALSAQLAGYRVSVRIEGPYDRREVVLTSQPPASQEDLMLMLVTGEPPRSSLTSRGSAAAARRVAVDVGRDLASRWFAGEGESVLDRLELETGAEETRSGGTTTDARFRLAGEALGPGRSAWLRGERDRFDAVNWGLRLVWRQR
jgi:hypothetical protein